LSFALRQDEHEVKKLSRAALEVLSIIAYHQPVTRAEIEDIRGVQTSKGTLDVLLEAHWVKFRGRRRTPGRPVTFGTTRDFLDHFGLEDIRDLPGVEELKAAGMLSGRIPAGLSVPIPKSDDDMGNEEDPITQLDLEELGLLTPGGGDEE
jgi:segregation and condensation protein B